MSGDPLVAAAIARSLVRLPDGRCARLFYAPMQGRPGRRLAKVILPSGAVLRVDPAGLEVLPTVTA